MSYTATVNSIIARLAGVAPSERGQSAVDHGQTTVPPRYVFVWKNVVEDVGGQLRRSSRSNPPVMQVDLHEIEVHLWADDSEAIETLRGALFTAIRAQQRGRRYVDRGMVPGDENVGPKKGMKAIVNVGLFIDLVATNLPASPTAKPGDDPTTTAVPATFPEATVSAIDNDPSGQTPGDGILELGEP